MYNHVGGDKIVKGKELIGIFNISIESAANALHVHNKQGNMPKIQLSTNEQIKSIILTDHYLYYSPVSSSTLKKRRNLFF